MQHVTVKPDVEFRVIAGSRRSQAAIMVLEAGESTGSTDNMHLESDQWLYVLGGSGTAIVEGFELKLVRGELILIEAGEVHEIFAGKDENLETLNIYAPPEYPLE